MNRYLYNTGSYDKKRFYIESYMSLYGTLNPVQWFFSEEAMNLEDLEREFNEQILI